MGKAIKAGVTKKHVKVKGPPRACDALRVALYAEINVIQNMELLKKEAAKLNKKILFYNEAINEEEGF